MKKHTIISKFGLMAILSMGLTLPLAGAQERPASLPASLDERVLRANFLVKELYKYTVEGEFLLEQSDRRNLRRILTGEEKFSLILPILRELFAGEFVVAHQIIQEAYGESVDFPDTSDFTLQDFSSFKIQQKIRNAVSNDAFDFLDQVSTPEIMHESRTIHKKETRKHSLSEHERAEQEAKEYESAVSQSEEQERLHQEELQRRQEQEEQELAQAIAQSQAEVETRRDAERKAEQEAQQRAEFEAKQQAEQEAKLSAPVKKSPQEKEAQKQQLFSQARAIKQEIADIQAAQADIIKQLLRLLTPTGPHVDKLNNQLTSYQEKIEPLEVKLFEIKQDLEKLEYPDNVIQYRLVPQKNNDCGLRSARHAVLGYLHATGKIDDKAFQDAIEVDEDALISINDLKNLVKPDGTLVFPLPPGSQDYATNEIQLESMVATVCRWPKIDTSSIDTSNITILPLILGIRDPEMQPIYGFIDQTRALIKEIRSKPNFVHAFILNADQTALYYPRVTHWLPIIVEKHNGKYTYTILDSLNKGRLELVLDLMYLIEKFQMPE